MFADIFSENSVVNLFLSGKLMPGFGRIWLPVMDHLETFKGNTRVRVREKSILEIKKAISFSDMAFYFGSPSGMLSKIYCLIYSL